VALVYFDSSALVKLVVEEEGSDIASALWDGCDAPFSSRLAYPEVCAALAAARRNHDLDDRGFEAAITDWEQFWQATRAVELTRDVERHAGELARRRTLRGADAVHLASARALETQDLVVAAWDRRLHESVVAEQLSAAPRSLPG
jgi:uncharacterized protein